MKLNNKYPEPVKEICNEVIDELQSQNFFTENEANKQITFDNLCESILPKFLNGEELLWTEDEMNMNLHLCIVKSVVKKLESDGMLKTFEDENGETVVFMTDEQKENTKDIFSSLKSDGSSK